MSALLLKELKDKKIIENIADIIVYYVRTHNHKWYLTQMGYNQYGIPSNIQEKQIDEKMTFSDWLHDVKPESGTDVPLELLKRRKWSLKDTITLYDRMAMLIDAGEKDMELVFYLFTATDNAIFAYINEIDYKFDLGDPDQIYCDEKYYKNLDWKAIKKEEVNVFLIMVTNACRRYPKLLTLLTSNSLISDEIFDKIFEKNLSVLQYAPLDFQTIERLKIIVKDDFRSWDTHNEGARQGWVQKLVLQNTKKFSPEDIKTLTTISNSSYSVLRNYNNSVGLLKVKPLIF
jgi:hypothetical protein